MKVYDIYEEYKDDDRALEIMEKSTLLFDEILDKLKQDHPELYEDYMNRLYIIAYGNHFNEDMLENAFEHMINDDGTKAPKWNLETTSKVASQHGVIFSDFNKYDWCYVMNMMYSDYHSVLGESLVNYVNMSVKFLNDKDAPNGKALLYYLAMQQG